MRRQPLNIHYLSRHLTRPKDTPKLPTTPSSSSRQKRSHHHTTATSSSSAITPHNRDIIPDCSLITPEIPTPDTFYDQTGYTFSAVPLGSNPLYNWSLTSNSTSTKEKNGSLEISTEDGASSGAGGQNGEDCQRLEESESILDFRVTSLDSGRGGGGGGGGGEKKDLVRPGYLWLPSLRNLEAQQRPPLPAVGGGVAGSQTDSSLPSSDCDANANCKREISQTNSGMTARE